MESLTAVDADWSLSVLSRSEALGWLVTVRASPVWSTQVLVGSGWGPDPGAAGN